jgi:hypothetical protein
MPLRKRYNSTLVGAYTVCNCMWAPFAIAGQFDAYCDRFLDSQRARKKELMSLHRVLYWSGPLGIAWIWIFEELNHWLQQKWDSRMIESSADRNFWLSIVLICFIVLVSAALATHRVFFLKRSAEARLLTAAWRLLPQLFLSGVLIGTSIVLNGPKVSDLFRSFGLAFLGHFLFCAAVVWSLMATLNGLLPSSASQGGNV